MTPTKGVTDEQRGKIYKKINAIIDRTGEGKSLSFDFVMEELQNIHDGLNLFDPHNFFVTRKGLLIAELFSDRILSVTKKTIKMSVARVRSFNLSKPMSDPEILKEVGDEYVYKDASEFWSVLTVMISRQPQGEGGYLLSDGTSNIFYVRGKNNEIFPTLVYWDSDHRLWFVRARQLDDDHGAVGTRVFSCNESLKK
ncbi:MAG: hypothetical protein PHX25_02705 [Candidatus Pacebacteria bacterium]|nr:hypothetical protein [Candidatus Paceibacterota bacterium]